jgi:tetratricopeptide (TPR) repeat protein
MKKLSTFVLVMIFGLNLSFAQDDESKFGDDPEQCKRNLSLMTDFYKSKSYQESEGYLAEAYQLCPEGSKNIYIYGANIYKQLIATEKDEEAKTGWINKLMDLYDARIKYFGQEGYVLGRKGADILRLTPSEYIKGYEALKRSVELEKNETEAGVISAYYQVLFIMLQRNDIDKLEFLDTYMTLTNIIDSNIEKAIKAGDDKTKDLYEKAQNNIDEFFIRGGAECDDIVPIFEKKLQDGDDIDLMKKALQIMDRRKCEDNDLYPVIAEKVHQSNPSHESAYSVGITKVKNKEFADALKYFEQAIELCDNCLSLSKYYSKASLVATNMGQTSKGRNFAKKMLEINPKDGEAYILIGDAIASAKGQCNDDLGGASVYWLAVDYYAKAKGVDSSLAEKANAKIGTYSKYFPEISDVFKLTLKEGDSYQIGCWINESTTVRARK